MILLEAESASPASSSRAFHIIAIFGVGLIGSAIVRQLRAQARATCYTLPFSWGNAHLRDEQLGDLELHILNKMKTLQNSGQIKEAIRFTVIWSAGSGGFGSDEGQMNEEYLNFKAVLHFADRISNMTPGIRQAFHMFSSAGGLFEGQTCVGPDTSPSPLRPYGRIKLLQEEALRQWQSTTDKVIYRPSSVYGISAPRHRAGLIPTLLISGMKHLGVRLFGAMDTIRDYVSSEDVARFVVNKIYSDSVSSQVYTLATARPVPLYDVKTVAEQTIRRSIFVQYSPEPEFSANNSYKASVLPADWTKTDLETGVRQLKFRLIGGP